MYACVCTYAYVCVFMYMHQLKEAHDELKGWWGSMMVQYRARKDSGDREEGATE